MPYPDYVAPVTLVCRESTLVIGPQAGLGRIDLQRYFVIDLSSLIALVGDCSSLRRDCSRQ